MGEKEEEGEKDEEELVPVDTKPECEASCKPRCVKQLLAYEACKKRIDGHEGKHCTGQYFDYWGCIDRCSATKLFCTLK